jgi:hypothetical protein
MRKWRDWIEETHSAGFELRRHFFLRFFDTDLISTPGQWRVVAGGAIGILASFSLIYTQAYYHKYLALNNLDDPEPYRLAVLADLLFLVTLAMFFMGLFTTLQWASLFPGKRDYLALASLPIRMRELFTARFTALLGFAGLVALATNLLPSIILPSVMSGGYGVNTRYQIAAIFVSCSLAAMLVFFSIVAVQGVLLNALPIRTFPRVSLAAQGVLLIVFLCGLPLVFSIPSLHESMRLRPEWAIFVPPAWFLGVDQVMVGNRESLAQRLALIGVCAVAVAAVAAISTYIWSYRRHRIRLLESADLERAAARLWPALVAARVAPDTRELAVFAFTAKTLVRSGQHRLVLTAFAALGLAIVFESFFSLAFSRTFHGFSTNSPALRQAAISAPLALSLFVLAGYRYLFRLPVEIRANWIFRVNEPGNRLRLLAGVEKFLLYCAVIPVALLTAPLLLQLLGMAAGLRAALLCLLCSLTLMQLVLIQSERIPFTSSYLPGQRPLIATVVLYVIGVIGYVSLLGAAITWSIQSAGWTAVLGGIFATAWWRAHSARIELSDLGQLEFEELPEPAVQTLSIERD